MSACVSTLQHRDRYKEPLDLLQNFVHIRTILQELLRLPDGPVRNRMLTHALWEVAIVSGNFYGRYRSEAVVTTPGVPIQRDHVISKALIRNQLTAGAITSDQAIEQAREVCIVTRQEHRDITNLKGVDGWDRYRKMEIKVRDMSTDTPFDFQS